MMFRHALRNLLRAWRGGELALLALSLLLAVSIVSGIAGFSERLNLAMLEQSQHSLAADRVLKSPRPLPQAWLKKAGELDLRQAQTLRFRSMLMADDQLQLVSIKAATAAYPLIGAIEAGDEVFGPGQLTEVGPAPGEIWLDSRLFSLLAITPGMKIELGELSLTASKVLISEPDQGGMSGLFAARALMNQKDVAATEVVQPGSRVSYRYLFSGDAEALEAYQQWLQPQLLPAHKWLDVRDGQPALAETLSRAEGYLLLAASLGVALAGVAVALAARRFGERHVDQVAVMKALGASRRYILHSFFVELFLLAVLATLMGAVVGKALQWSLFYSLRELIDLEIPSAGWLPLLVGGATALVCTLVFAMPPIWQLSRVSPLRVLRRDQAAGSTALVASGGLGLFGIAGLMWWYSGNLWIALAVMFASITLVVLAMVSVLLLIRFAKFRAEKAKGTRLRLVLAAIYRRRFANAFQVASFALALMALASLAVLRESLIEDWQLQVDVGALNHFLINIQNVELAPLQVFFQRQEISYAGLYPMVRGRLSHIDGNAVGDIKGIDKAEDNIDREMNLSWAETLPDDNRLLSGRWWQAGDKQREPLPVSVEVDIAEQLKLELGSRLRFDLGGQSLFAEVASIRSLEWTSMRPNFYFIFPPDSLSQYAGSYITSFYLPPDKKPLLSELLRQFPTFTLIEIDGILKQMKTVIAQLSAAIGLVLAMVLVCALLVTLANVQASLDSRLKENALLRTLGASTSLISSSLLAEFVVMGAMAGLLAAVGCNLTLSAVQLWVLDMPLVWHWPVFIAAPLFGGFLFAATGWLGCRRVVSAPPMAILRS